MNRAIFEIGIGGLIIIGLLLVRVDYLHSNQTTIHKTMKKQDRIVSCR